MGPAKLITVFGATGNQGGSVVRSLLLNKEFRVRGLSRNPGSEASKALAAQNVEIVKANGFNAGEMRVAFEGSWGVFLNINSDDKIFTDPNGPTEFDMGKTIADAAKAAGVQCFVFSSGPPCTTMTGGKVQMKAMDMKYKIEIYCRENELFPSFVSIGAGWFLENFLSKEVAPIFGGFPHFPDEDGYLTFRVPKWGGQEDVPWLSITDDFGDIVQGLFLRPHEFSNGIVHGVSYIGSFDNITADFEAATGRKSRYVPILPTWEAFNTHGIHELEDVKLMFGFTQITGGRYFGSEPTNSGAASYLKGVTSMTLGRPEDQRKLVTAQDWFAQQFGK